MVALFRLRSHCPQIGSDGSNPIGFFDAQLARIADFDASCRVGRNRRQHRDFIDQRRSIGPRNGSPAQFLALYLNRAL